MKQITQDYWEGLADVIHKQYDDVSVVEIANDLGFDVRTASFEEENIYGYVLNSQSEKVIYVNEAESKRSQRCIVAHEIGHILIHHELDQDKEYVEVDFMSSDNYDIRELQADGFAAALLMPKDETHKIWKKLDDVDDIAEHFDVTKKIAAVRLIDLELI